MARETAWAMACGMPLALGAAQVGRHADAPAPARETTVASQEADRVNGLLARREADVRAVARVSVGFWPWIDTHPEVRAGLLLSADPSRPTHAENLDALRQAVGAVQAEAYAHLLLAAALQEADVRVPSPTVAARAGSMSDTGRSGPYPPRIAPTLVEQVKAQIERLETTVPVRDKLRWPLFGVKDAPYYLLHPLTLEVSLREQAFIWNRFLRAEAGSDRLLTRASAAYGWEYTLPEVRGRKSDWEPDSIPRIVEDGGVCGRLARLEATGLAVLGVPAATAGQPGHCALMAVEEVQGKDGVRKFEAQIRQSESGDWSSTRPHHPPGLTPAIAGFEHEAVAWLALVETANRVKLRDYLDALALVRIAQDEPEASKKVALLESALARDPFHLAGWEILLREKGRTPETFNAAMRACVRALLPAHARIAQVLVARQVAPVYTRFLSEDVAVSKEAVASLGSLIASLDDDGVLGVGAEIHPLYLRHLARVDGVRALEAAQVGLERALLGRREASLILDESASPLAVAVRGLEEVASGLPAARRAEVFAEACERIETAYPPFEPVSRPELVGGKTVYPERLVPNKAHARAFARRCEALREAGRGPKAQMLEKALAARRQKP